MKKEFLIIALIAIAFGCKNGKEHSVDEKKYQFQVARTESLANVHVPSRYYYTINSDMNWQLQVDEKKIENVTKSTVGLLYQAEIDSAGSKIITITYDSLHVYARKNDHETIADATANEAFASPVDNILRLIKGTSIKILIDKKGSVVDIQGSREVADKILQHVQTRDEREQKMVRSTIEKFTGADFIKHNIAQMSSFYPDSSVYIGDSWSKKGVINNDLKLESLTEYTLKSVDNNIAEISAVSQFDNLDNNAVAEELGNGASKIAIKGKDETRYYIDMKTGVIFQTRSETILKGTVQTMLKSDIPVTIKSKREINVKKL